MSQIILLNRIIHLTTKKLAPMENRGTRTHGDGQSDSCRGERSKSHDDRWFMRRKQKTTPAWTSRSTILNRRSSLSRSAQCCALTPAQLCKVARVYGDGRSLVDEGDERLLLDHNHHVLLTHTAHSDYLAQLRVPFEDITVFFISASSFITWRTSRQPEFLLWPSP